MQGQRKLVAYITAVAATILLALTDTMTGDNVESVFNTIIWAFVIGNGGEHLSKQFGTKLS